MSLPADERQSSDGSPGPVLGVAPFNFPLNLVAHKVVPAIAVGAPVIVAFPEDAAVGAAVSEILSETDLPAGVVSVLPVGVDQTLTLVDDPRLPIVSFTGSDVVGSDLCCTGPSQEGCSRTRWRRSCDRLR